VQSTGVGRGLVHQLACGQLLSNLSVSLLQAKAEAVKQEGKALAWGPSLVRTAIENTASLVFGGPRRHPHLRPRTPAS